MWWSIFRKRTCGVCDFSFDHLAHLFRIKIHQGPDDLVYLPKKMAQVVFRLVGWMEAESGSQ